MNDNSVTVEQTEISSEGLQGATCITSVQPEQSMQGSTVVSNECGKVQCPVVTSLAESTDAGDPNKVRRGRKPDLRRLRTLMGVNQCELAKTLNVTQAMVSMIESGKAKPGKDLWNKIYELTQQAKRQ